MVGMDGRSRADMRLGRSAVEARDPVEPQPVQQVRVVAVTEEPRGVLADDVSVEVAEHGHLVVAADRREDRAHGRIGERRHQILSALRRARGPAREGILHWLDPDDLTKPTQGLLVDRGVPLGGRPRRRDHRDAATVRHGRRHEQVLGHAGQRARVDA
jgi:hypothetical protein